jgi:hypothetical protein
VRSKTRGKEIQKGEEKDERRYRAGRKRAE